MPLFLVNIEGEFVVQAKDEVDAKLYANGNLDNILRDEGNDIFSVSLHEITNEKNTPGWAREDYIPHGGDDCTTVEEILHITKEELKVKKDKEYADSQQLKFDL